MRPDFIWRQGERVLRGLLGVFLLHLSIGVVRHGGSRLLVLLGIVESVAALLFLFRRTVRWGGVLLLLTFAFAAGFHLRAGERPLPLIGFAVAVALLTGLASRPVAPSGTRLGTADRAFLRAFERAKIVAADFHHREHVRAAWALLCRYPLSEALGRYSAALKRITKRAGQPGIYHETITWAYLLLIHERLEKDGRGLPFADFAARHPDLMTGQPSILLTYYRPEVLKSEHARQVFVLPQAPAAPPTS